MLAPASDLQAALSCDASGCGAVVEDALMARLGVKTGEAIHIGDADFVVRARIVTEPDRVAGGFTLGPRVLISSADFARANLITPGSLLNYSYRVAFAGETTPEQFRASLQAAFPEAVWEINDRSNAIPRVTRFVEQATMFLTLVGLTALVVAGVGAGQAVEAFLQRRRATIATLKAMGAEGSDIFLIYLLQIMAVAAVGLVLGLALGAALPFAVEHFFGEQIPAPAHYAVYAGPLVLAAAFGTLAALGFAILPLARAREIAPAGLFRDLVAPSSRHGRWPYRVAAFAAFGSIAALSILLSPYPLFNLGFLGGSFAVLLALRLIASGFPPCPDADAAPQVPTPAPGFGQSHTARHADRQHHRRAGPRPHAACDGCADPSERGSPGRRPIASRAPSFFFVDIQQNQIDAFTKLVSGFPTAADFNATPMLRARIVKLNGVPVADAKVATDSRWAVDGDRAITYSTTRPKEARVVEGPSWWPADYRGPSLVSFSRDLARGMGLKIGDTITVNIIGRDLDLRIFNLRDIDFRTGGMNFVLMASPGVVDQAPHTFLSTVRAAPAQEEAMFAAVSKDFPNVTVVRVKEALAQVGELLAALARGIAIASLVTILAGVLVLAGAIAAGHRARGSTMRWCSRCWARRARGWVRSMRSNMACSARWRASRRSSPEPWRLGQSPISCSTFPLVFAGRAVAFTIAGGALGTLVLGLSGGFAAMAAKPAARLRNP